MSLPKPLEMTDSEILDWIQENCIHQNGDMYAVCSEKDSLTFEKWVVNKDLRQAVCQAAILKEQEK